MCVHVCMCVRIEQQVLLYVCGCMCMYIYMCAHMYTYMCTTKGLKPTYNSPNTELKEVLGLGRTHAITALLLLTLPAPSAAHGEPSLLLGLRRVGIREEAGRPPPHPAVPSLELSPNTARWPCARSPMRGSR